MVVNLDTDVAAKEKKEDLVPDITLTAADIMNTKDTELERVPVPEWGGYVFVRGLTGIERDAFEASMLKGEGKKQRVDTQNIRAKLCSLAIVDEKGNRIFNTLEMIAALGKKSAAALNRVYTIAAKRSGISDEDVEELAKNSDGDLSVEI